MRVLSKKVIDGIRACVRESIPVWKAGEPRAGKVSESAGATAHGKKGQSFALNLGL